MKRRWLVIIAILVAALVLSSCARVSVPPTTIPTPMPSSPPTPAVAAPEPAPATTEPSPALGSAPVPATTPIPEPVTTLPAPAPSYVPAPVTTPAPEPAITPSTATSLQQLYGSEVISYFYEIALGTEYGSSTPVLRKWTSEVRIQTHGSPNSADLAALSLIVGELNDLVGAVSEVRLQIVDTRPNVEIYFAPESQFLSIEPNYVATNLGFFYMWWDQSNAIIKARILIDTARVTQQERQHLLREELTQSLGLARDSWKYPNSIFYQGWTATQQYTPIDRNLIKLLYERQLRPGLTRLQLEDVFSAVTSN